MKAINSSFTLRIFLVLLAVSLIANVSLWLLSVRIFPDSNSTAVLHYSSDFGIDFIGDSSHISVLPRLGTLLLIFNLLIGGAIFRVESRAAWTLWAINPFLQAVLLGALYLIWQINQ
jgi:hypothetical protein